MTTRPTAGANSGLLDTDPVLAGQVAAALGVGTVMEPVVAVQHTSFPTWRLTTGTGRYLVKRLWLGPDPDWWVERRDGMAYELRAIGAGVRAADPVIPPSPAFGCAVRIEQVGVFRAHRWLDHRAVTPDDDLDDWLGATLATLHGLQPEERPDIPAWWGLYAPAQWADWIDHAEHRGLVWTRPLRAALPDLLELSDRLRAVNERSGDHVISHGDVEPYNVLITGDGPTLIDWDSVLVESATLELGRTAVTFGGEDLVRVSSILGSYLNHGGTIAPLGPDLLLRPVALNLCHLTERITAALGDRTDPGWIDREKVDAGILRGTIAIPARTARLTALAEQLY